MAARQELSRQGVGLANPDNSDTLRWLRWRTGDAARRRRRRAGAGGHCGSPQPESCVTSWTGGGAARAGTRRVYALLDWDNLPAQCRAAPLDCVTGMSSGGAVTRPDPYLRPRFMTPETRMGGNQVMSHSGLGLPGLVCSPLVRADVTRLDQTALSAGTPLVPYVFSHFPPRTALTQVAHGWG